MYNMFSMKKTEAAGVNNAHTDLHQSADQEETVLANRDTILIFYMYIYTYIYLYICHTERRTCQRGEQPFFPFLSK